MYAKGDELWSEAYDKATVDSFGSVSLVKTFVARLTGSVGKYFIHQIKHLDRTNRANSSHKICIPVYSRIYNFHEST